MKKKDKIIIFEEISAPKNDLKSILKKNGFWVRRVSINIDQVLYVIKEEKPNLVLLGFQLEGSSSNGEDIIGIAKTINYDYNIPFLFHTAFPNRKIMDRVLEAEPAGIFTYPFREHDIAYTVKSVIRKYKRVHHLTEANKLLVDEIEEKRETEKPLLLLQKAVSQSPSTVVITDLDATIEYVNPAFTKVTGYSYREAIGSNTKVLNSGKTSKKLITELWKTIKSGNTWKGEFVNKKKSGEIYYEAATIGPVKDDFNQVFAYIAVKDDITKQKEAEKILKTKNEQLALVNEAYASQNEELNKVLHLLEKSEKRFRIIFEAAEDFLFIIDTSLKYVSVNPALENVFSLSSDKIIGKTDEQLFPEHHAEKIMQQNKKVLSGESIAIENTLEINGKTYTFSTTKVPIRDANGKITGLFGISRDITSRKKMEKELLEAKKNAEQVANAKSEFLARMSHELRTPLNSIIGFSQILKMKVKGNLNKEQDEFLDYIRLNGNHLLEMVNDILDLSKIEAGKIDIEKTKFNLAGLLKSVIFIVKPIAQPRNIDLQISISKDITDYYGDEIRIKQIIYNLISNAIKFTADGKSVGIRAKEKKGFIHIIVWDEGIGISKEDSKKIFLPFEQGHQEKGVQAKGTGLGLAISQKLIKMHGGRISVKSKIGVGSEFIMELPIVSLKDKKENKSTSLLPANKSHLFGEIKLEKKDAYNILVVDDNIDNQNLIKIVLMKCKLPADYAKSGEEALEMADAKEYDLVFMDIQMPGMDGIEAMSKIKKKYDVKIIVLTANAMKGDDKRYFEAGFDDYIAKPFNIPNFIAKINRMIS